MASNRSVLGACPRCQHRIPAAQLLINYQTDEGQQIWAECPRCHEVVHPRRAEEGISTTLDGSYRVLSASGNRTFTEVVLVTQLMKVREATPEDAASVQAVARAAWHAAHDHILGEAIVEQLLAKIQEKREQADGDIENQSIASDHPMHPIPTQRTTVKTTASEHFLIAG